MLGPAGGGDGRPPPFLPRQLTAPSPAAPATTQQPQPHSHLIQIEKPLGQAAPDVRLPGLVGWAGHLAGRGFPGVLTVTWVSASRGGPPWGLHNLGGWASGPHHFKSLIG